ncbi:hypothetical protein PSH58_11755 [Pseudomonas hefeiensis]|uniref:Uncharacterized protein n=1 Tax=Pseudomonas hefeiensis TaxID=2738125 RepID=A0ABY9GH88_9PSED|nr:MULTISPECIES: hypothetical protein [unclassified Pseudomonas]WLH14912.1 hypothetical protein PSH57_11730 [Pseudomonas sp. FP205]WLH97962.1 hypothetical protein PSH58_11755 [Pseudomonas sp. FP53]WLI42237.1 hypothetical protein PSH74_11705 [Pseudomonas sp. FP821]
MSRRQGGTLSSRYRSNGYAHYPSGKRRVDFSKKTKNKKTALFISETIAVFPK